MSTVPYLELDTPRFLASVRMFNERKPGPSVVLSNAAMLVVHRDTGMLRMETTDGTVYMRSLMAYTSCSDGFPTESILDIETLTRVSQLKSSSLSILFDRGDYYVELFGGRVFVPSYKVKADTLAWKEVESAKDKSVEMLTAVRPDFKADNFLIEPTTMRSVLDISQTYLSSASNELAFAYCVPDAVYMANSMSVFRMAGALGRFKLRRSDLPMIAAAVESNTKQLVQVKLAKSRITMQTESYAIQVPYLDLVFSDSWVLMSKNADTGYYVDGDTLFTALSLMDQDATGAGSVTFTSTGNSLTVESSTREGKSSFVSLARSESPVAAFRLSVRTKSLLASLRVMKDDAVIRVGVAEPNLVFNTDQKTLVVFGKSI